MNLNNFLKFFIRPVTCYEIRFILTVNIKKTIQIICEMISCTILFLVQENEANLMLEQVVNDLKSKQQKPNLSR